MVYSLKSKELENGLDCSKKLENGLDYSKKLENGLDCSKELENGMAVMYFQLKSKNMKKYIN